MATFEDFSIHIGSRSGQVYPVSVISSPEGTGRGALRLPYRLDDIGGILTTLGHAVRGTRDMRPAPVSTPKPVDTGAALFEALFSGNVEALFNKSLGRIGARNQVLRIKLHMDLEDPTLAPLASLPWELLYRRETREFLALSPCFTIVRYLDVQRPAEVPPFKPPLRILFVMANPKGDLKLEEERRRIEQELEREAAGVQASFLVGARYAELEDRLHEDDYHVLHYMGHGGFDGAEGALLLEDRAVKGQALGVLLGKEPETRLVFLNACSTARVTKQQGRDPFAGVASALVMAGVPAVVAMQFPITDEAAIGFAGRFYGEIARGKPVEEAVDAGRMKIHGLDPEKQEWATPVLFMRGEGHLFGRPAPEVPEEKGATVVASVTVNPANFTADIGQRVQLQGRALNDDAKPITDIPLTWSSEHPSIATVDATTGMVTALAAGSATIRARHGGVEGHTVVAVQPPVVYHPEPVDEVLRSVEFKDLEGQVEICLVVKTKSGWWKGIGFNTYDPIVEGEKREGYQCTRIEPAIGKVSFFKAKIAGRHTFIGEEELDLRKYANHRVLFTWTKDSA